MAKRIRKKGNPHSKFLSKDLAKRQNQLANLKKGSHRPRRKSLKVPPSEILDEMQTLSIIPYVEKHFYTKEDRENPMELLAWQYQVLLEIFYAEKLPKLAVVGSVKKSGKSALGACVAQYYLTNKPMAEIFILAPDREAGQSIIFRSLINSIRLHPVLRDCCSILKDEIHFGDSFVKVLACDLSIAGLRSDLTLIDEPWQFRTPNSQKVLDEMTTNPVGDHLTLAVSYAGYTEDQSDDLALWKWYSRGRAIEAGEEKPDLNFYFYWKQDYKHVPWVEGTDYLEHQQKILRPSTFARFHRNEWAPSDSGYFVSADEIDRCIRKQQTRGQDNGSAIIVGLDIGYRHDATALVAVGQFDDRRLAVVDHRCFVPKDGETLSLQNTVKNTLIEWDIDYRIAEVVFDPFQAIHLSQELLLKGLNMFEYQQTASNLHKMCECLQDLIKNLNLLLYDDPEIRYHLLNSKVRESPQGLKITKSTQSRRIDLTVALAMACTRAMEYLAPAVEPEFYEAGLYHDFGEEYYRDYERMFA